jgi:hypothetical protein
MPLIQSFAIYFGTSGPVFSKLVALTCQTQFLASEVGHKKITRYEKFLAHMEALIPWAQLLTVIEPI